MRGPRLVRSPARVRERTRDVEELRGRAQARAAHARRLPLARKTGAKAEGGAGRKRAPAGKGKARAVEAPPEREKRPESPAPAAGKVAAGAGPSPLPKLLGLFEEALECLGRQDWRGATEGLETILGSAGVPVELADRVRCYMRVCERGIASAPPRLESAEDHYQLGILRLNAGELEEAEGLLARACLLEPTSDKALYGLAVVQAQQRRTQEALANLRRSIELAPDNRVYALHDSDLDELRDEPEFTELVGRPGEGGRPRADGAEPSG